MLLLRTVPDEVRVFVLGLKRTAFAVVVLPEVTVPVVVREVAFTLGVVLTEELRVEAITLSGAVACAVLSREDAVKVERWFPRVLSPPAKRTPVR